MLKCPFCDYQLANEKVVFCTNCGARIADDIKQSSASERLKFWGGELRMLSVFFVNFLGFEKLIGKQVNNDILINLRECMNEVEDIIKQFDGTSNQIIPDQRVLGIFGAPKAHKDDPLRTVRCAWKIRNWWKKKKNDVKFLTQVDLTLGINTGRAFFGYILEESSFLTVIGDTINTAARLTEISLPDEILISENTRDRVIEYVDIEHIGERSIKGRSSKVNVYRLKNIKEESEILPSQKIPLFGRDTELNKLIKIVQDLEKNQARICVITGQMGIGKTRLKEEFENFLTEDKSVDFVEMHCSVEISSPYCPFEFLLRHYLKLEKFVNKKILANKINEIIAKKGLLPINARGLKHLFLTDLHRLNSGEIFSINEEIYISVKNLIKHECRKAHLILIFEEFNKADEMTKHLVDYLFHELKDEPVLFLLVNGSKDFITTNDVVIDEINLTPLSLKDIKNLVDFILNDVDDRLVEFLYKSAGGNPLFTITAIRNTRRSRLIKKVSGRWHLEKEQRLPFLDDLYGVVMSTIDSLSPDYRLIIDYASVIGYRFSYRILAGLFKRANLKEQLHHLIEEGYIILSHSDKDPIYVFRHNLLKDAAYTVLPLRKRKEIHQVVANLFERLYADHLSDFYEDIGHHYLSCEDFKRTAKYFKLAGDKAKNLYAINQALYFYNTVLKISKGSEDQASTDLVRDVLLNLSDLYEITGDIKKMNKTAEQGLQNARRAKNIVSEVDFTERYAYGLFLLNKFDKAEDLFLTGVEQCNDNMTEVLSVLYSDLGILYQNKYEYEKSVLNYNLSWNTARANQIKKGEVLCLLNLSQLHKSLGNYEQALDYLNHGLNDLIPADNMRWYVQFKYMIADINYQMWNLEKAQEILLECFEISDNVGNIEVYLKSALDLAIINTIKANSEEARSYLQLADKKVSLFIRENLLSEINLKKAIVYNNESMQQKVKDYITNALKIAQKFHQKEIEFSCYKLLSLTDTESSLEYAQQVLDIAETIKLPPLIADALFGMAEIYTRLDDSEKARYYGQKALRIYDDLKFKLSDENRQFYVRRPEYKKLMEM